MKRVGKYLLFAGIVVAVVVIGFWPRSYERAGEEPSTYTVEELRHEPEHRWVQTTEVTDDADWIVKATATDGKPARFYVSRETYERLRVGEELPGIPADWRTTDPDFYEVLECRDPRDNL